MNMYLKWLLYCIPDIAMQVIGKLLSPVLPFFVRTKRNKEGKIDWVTDGSAMQAHLPKWLLWFETDDHDCDGDRGSWERHPGFDWWSVYKRRTAWFFRNTAYGFCINVIGIKVTPQDKLVVTGNTEASDTNGISGSCFRKVYKKDGEWFEPSEYSPYPCAFQWYYIKWYHIGKIKACIRIGLGWKLWGNWHNENGKVAMHQLYFNPFKKFQIVTSNK